MWLRCQGISENRITRSALLELTTSCNLDCPYCYVNRPRGQTFNTEYLQHLRELGLDMLSFTGGEPLVEKGKLLQICDELDLPMYGLITNSLLLDYSALKSLISSRVYLYVISWRGQKDRLDLLHRLLPLFPYVYVILVCYAPTLSPHPDFEMLKERFPRFSVKHNVGAEIWWSLTCDLARKLEVRGYDICPGLLFIDVEGNCYNGIPYYPGGYKYLGHITETEKLREYLDKREQRLCPRASLQYTEGISAYAGSLCP